MPRRSTAAPTTVVKTKGALKAQPIEYPDGCRELLTDMNAKELIEGLNVSHCKKEGLLRNVCLS